MPDGLRGGAGAQRFLLLYALAWAGGSVAYVPFLTLLLPLRVAAMAGPGRDIGWLAYLAFAGAVAASLGHIAFGWLSDVTGRRRLWIWLGLGLSTLLLVSMPAARDLAGLMTLVVLWQLGLNMMLGPLAALAGDCVPDGRKGLLGGLLAFAPAVGALSGALVTIPGFASPETRLVLTAAIVALCVMPVLLMSVPVPVTGGPRPVAANAPPAVPRQPFPRSALVRMGLARLAVQVAEAALFAYLFYWFRSIDPDFGDNRSARIFTVVLILSAPAAMLAGRWSDARGRPLLPLVVCALFSAVGLAGMALARGLPLAIGSYAVFGFATAVFLALHSAQTLRVLPRSDRRGRDLGFVNLTNTVPSLVMPWLTLGLVPYFGFAGLFALLAALALTAAALLVPLLRRF